MGLSLPIPTFFSEDSDTIVSDIKTYMEGLLGKSIAPADPEMLLINGFAYREYIKNVQANETARQNLLFFASGNMLDYIAELDAVYRLPSSSAVATLQFTLVDGHSDITIPQGVRIQTIDQKFVFITAESVTILAGTNTATVSIYASTAGTDGNGYAIGQISVLMDPQPYVTSVTNTDITSGGSDSETDDALRQRVVDAKSSYSVAGPKGAYIYFAKTASSAIIDVAVNTPVAGEVHIYPLLKGGLIPSQEILDLVEAACTPDEVRPLCDTVIVAAPTKVDYSIEVHLTLFDDAIQSIVESQVNDNLNAYVSAGKNKLGRDVTLDQIKALSVIKDQVYKADIISPTADIIADESVFVNNAGITVITSGTNHG